MKYMFNNLNDTPFPDSAETKSPDQKKPERPSHQSAYPPKTDEGPNTRLETEPKPQTAPVERSAPRKVIEPVYVKTTSKIPLGSLSIAKTSKTPKVLLDPRLGKYEISGRSLPEDAVGFYKRIINWLNQFKEEYSFDKEVRFELELEYFNTSSSKCLLDVFKAIAGMHDEGKNVSILWRYDEEDEDMEETGEDYRDLLNVPFILEGVEY